MSRSYKKRKKNPDRNHTMANNAISRHTVNKTMLNAKRRVQRRKNMTPLQRVLLKEAMEKEIEKEKELTNESGDGEPEGARGDIPGERSEDGDSQSD